MKTLMALPILISLLVSCSRIYYAPNTANVPLHSKKGETKIYVLYSLGTRTNLKAGELQLSHAIGNHTAFMINGFRGAVSEIETDWGIFPGPDRHEKGHGHHLEFASGYFKNLNEECIFEIYGGFGWGSVHNNYDRLGISRVNHTKFFLQPAVGFKSQHFEFGFAHRISSVHSKIIDSTGSYPIEQLSIISEKPHLLLFEPTMVLRGGHRNIKIQMHVSYTTPLNTRTYNTIVERVNFGAGVCVVINGRKKLN